MTGEAIVWLSTNSNRGKAPAVYHAERGCCQKRKPYVPTQKKYADEAGMQACGHCCVDSDAA